MWEKSCDLYNPRQNTIREKLGREYNSQQPFLNQRKEENGHRNFFMTNLRESMGPGWDRTHPLDLQSDMYLQSDTLPTALPGPVIMMM